MSSSAEMYRYDKAYPTTVMYNYLKNLITSGTLKSGDSLPTTAEILNHFNSKTPHYAVAARKKLKAEGLIVAVHDKTFNGFKVI